jgi:hypothetical protein
LMNVKEDLCIGGALGRWDEGYFNYNRFLCRYDSLERVNTDFLALFLILKLEFKVERDRVGDWVLLNILIVT